MFLSFTKETLDIPISYLLLQGLQRLKLQPGQLHLDVAWFIRDGKSKDELQSQECMLEEKGQELVGTGTLSPKAVGALSQPQHLLMAKQPAVHPLRSTQ